jgi:hypothetical protein
MNYRKNTKEDLDYIKTRTGPKPDTKVKPKLNSKPKTRPIKSNNQRRV